MDSGRLAPWVLVLCFVLCAVGSVQASFRLFDAFEDESVGPIDDQDGWNSGGGDNRVVPDPGGGQNQVLYVPSESSTLHKSLLDRYVGIPNGTVRMMFMRIRVGNKQTFSSGVTRASYPSEFSDFASEIGMANSSQNLDLRAWDENDGNYENVTQLDPDTWYNMWVLIDALQDTYQIWINDESGSNATTNS